MNTTAERYARCRFHYAPLAGFLLITRNGENVTPTNMPEWQEALSVFLELRAAGRLVLLDTVEFGHPLYSGHRGKVLVYAWESIWTVTMATLLLRGFEEIAASDLALSAALVSAVNAGKPGKVYRVTLGGVEMRKLVLIVHARSTKRAMQFAWAYARCRWLNTKQDRQRDTRRVWIETCALYTNS